LALLVVIMAAVCTPAHAVDMVIIGGLQTTLDAVNFPAGPVLLGPYDSGLMVLESSDPEGDATAMARATITSNGDFRVFLQAQANYSSVNPAWLASANLLMIVTDFITFSSTTLAGGTPIEARLTVQLHSTLTCLDNPTSAGITVFANADGAPLGFITGTCETTGDGSFTAPIYSTVGGTVVLDRYLDTFASAHLAGSTSAFSEVDAYNTATFRLTLLTGGVTYTSEGGFDYAPEPGSMFLMLGGAGLLAVGAWRRKRS
jgi:hypothetical protein